MIILLVAALTVVFLAAILLDKAYQAVPLYELRRRARGGKDKRAAQIYEMAAYGTSLGLFLWLIGGLSAAGLVIMAKDNGWWVLALAVLALAWFIWLGRPLRKASGLAWQLASLLAPPVSSLLGFLQPVLGRIGQWVEEIRPKNTHSRIYEKEDLAELLKSQTHQLDNRISDIELRLLRRALAFGDKTAGKIMRPKAKVKWVAAEDAIGPHLMDELHASKQSRFAVVEDPAKLSATEIVGVLNLSDLISHKSGGKVRDLASRKPFFINEAHNLAQALQAFFVTHQYLLVVVNNFEEVLGVLTLEDLLGQIMGGKVDDEFTEYGNLRAVAGFDPGKENSKQDLSALK